MTIAVALLTLIGIPSPFSVHTLRKRIGGIQENVKVETELATMVEYCYQARREDHFSLLSLLNKDQGDLYPQYSSLRHNIARLGEHMKVVGTLLAVQKEYPELLDAKIDAPIKSSLELPFPKLYEIPLPELIISTVDTKEDVKACHYALQGIATCFSNAANPEAYVRGICERPTTTRVHAELVLFDWFWSSQSRYYAEDKYIGCSKAACYSCDRYAQALSVGDKVALRGCHNKLYLSWRPPDIGSGSNVQIKIGKEM